MAEPVTTTIDVSDMAAVHQVFRDAFGSPAALVSTVGSEDVERQILVGEYYSEVLALLAVHHEGEDELVWPLLRERAPQHVELVAEMEGQHHQIHADVERAVEALAAWSTAPHPDTADSLVAALEAVDASLIPHLDREEREILPIAAVTMTGEEWGRLPQHGTEHFRGEKLWLILGLIREQMTPDQLAAMDAAMPPPAVEFWRDAGQGMFDDFMARLRG
jgi:iron-sulfur cluster repair protein YtfE (RIC family)